MWQPLGLLWGIIPLIFGILVLVYPRFLRYTVGIYLIIVGLWAIIPRLRFLLSFKPGLPGLGIVAGHRLASPAQDGHAQEQGIL